MYYISVYPFITNMRIVRVLVAQNSLHKEEKQ